jgi:hypothetical protein
MRQPRKRTGIPIWPRLKQPIMDIQYAVDLLGDGDRPAGCPQEVDA